jgi:hypothetical protein
MACSGTALLYFTGALCDATFMLGARVKIFFPIQRTKTCEISGSHGDDMNMTVFWNAASYGLVEIERFRGFDCLHYQGDIDGGSKHV